MRTVTLGKSGFEVAELGFGAMYLPRLQPDAAVRLVEEALDAGITYFDTAAAYQDSEEKLGCVLPNRPRDSFVLTSRSMAYKFGPAQFEAEFARSMERLQLPYIDFYGFHAVNQPDELEQAMGRPLAFLQEQQRQGRIRHLAITSHNHLTLQQALRSGAFALCMFPFNVIEQEPLQGLLATARQQGVAATVMKPLAGGVIEDTDKAFRFLFSHDPGVVTPGMKSSAELRQNLAVFEGRAPLADDELAVLKERVAHLGQDFCRRCSYCMPCPQGVMIPFLHMIHMKTVGRPMDDEVLYTLKLARNMLPALEKCDGCGACREKCPYDIDTPQRVAEVLALLRSVDEASAG